VARGSQDIVVDIETSYGLDGPGIDTPLGARISASVQTGSEAHSASYTICAGSFLGAKRPECGVDHPPTSSLEVKERVGLYFYSPSGPSCLLLG